MKRWLCLNGKKTTAEVIKSRVEEGASSGGARDRPGEGSKTYRYFLLLEFLTEDKRRVKGEILVSVEEFDALRKEYEIVYNPLHAEDFLQVSRLSEDYKIGALLGGVTAVLLVGAGLGLTGACIWWSIFPLFGLAALVMVVILMSCNRGNAFPYPYREGGKWDRKLIEGYG
uniref:Uncharacterized protein n=1 Tax=Chromera velia CCMP2878 TaxID=1169474 RepID=A0A0G4GXE7_9ALVE|eukprot:Cvel_5361.t1-p1 / transcript=Cvel_5361.t1 / gene=Cvel_5361 / organism=Chromera_velia_CCMP2878 / gene_product=hypothetical protein / transcript_product=hypothetical protein / location=Cvel_scaffold249:25598-26107(-) / protein_length=170 / sequence_SO=supercontig / SO=protein_coding / is_pseudo=false